MEVNTQQIVNKSLNSQLNKPSNMSILSLILQIPNLELSYYFNIIFNNIIRTSKIVSKQEMAQAVAFNQKLNILRSTIQKFPLKCKFFLNHLLSLIHQPNHIQNVKDFKIPESPFIHTFGSFSTDQKLYFLSQISNHINAYLKNQRKGATQMVHQIETTCQMKTSLMGFTYWQQRTFKYDYRLNYVRLVTSKKELSLDLKMFLMRKSTSEKNSIVFESISKQIPERMSKITLRFSNSSIFQQIHNNVRRIIIELSQKKIQDLLSDDTNQNRNQAICQKNKTQKKFTLLTSKTLRENFNKNEKIIEKLNKNKNKSTIIFYKNNIKIFKSEENKKYFYLEQNIVSSKNMKNIQQNITILRSPPFQQKLLCEVLETFTKNITVNYFKVNIGPKQYEFVTTVEKTQNEGYYQVLMKTMTHLSLDISIEFIKATIRKISNNQYTFQLSLILDSHSKKTSIVNGDAISLMLQMTGCGQEYDQKNLITKKVSLNGGNHYSIVVPQDIQRIQPSQLDQSLQVNFGNQYDQRLTTSSVKKSSSKQSEEQNNQDEVFFTVIGQNEEQLDPQTFSPFQDQNFSKKNAEQITNKSDVNTELAITKDFNYLKIRPFNRPVIGPLKIVQKNFLSGEWKKSAKGGVVCIDQEVIKEQKKIVKAMFAKIGNNIFKGSNVMNISLPVQAFRNQSSLISIGRNISYAPLLIQPSVLLSSLQRMKKIIVFQISMSTLALSTKKPFNPILGETYQGDIGGCPLFLEQISHHPPITTLYYIGRGYKIYGTMTLQVGLRLNHVRGISNGQMTIQFDNGQKVEFELPAMLINGLIFGQRSIYYEGIVYIIDSRNNLITEITYNASASKKGLFSFKSQSPDYLSGEIYQVTPIFMEKFIASKHKISLKKDETNKIVARINGQWNGKIFINDQQVFNFQSQLPIELKNYYCPLPSDSVYRTDVIELGKGDMTIAQDEKDRLEEIQRRDKKMRLSYNSTKPHK